jgi:RNA polymerase sigma-70 factor (ECF subfamily)
MAGDKAKRNNSIVLTDAIWAHLGEHLRDLYGNVISADLPRDLTKLIERLKKAIRARNEPLEPAFIADLVRCVPHLRAFAISLTRNPDQAEDLVQDTLLKACDKRDSFELGTSLQAWLFTILRNSFHTEHRKRRREVEDSEGTHAQALVSLPDQIARLELQDLSIALSKLDADQRQAILLVGAEGMSYEDAAMAAGVPLGTIKSRVNRARHRLVELLELNPDDILGTRFTHQ